MRNEHPARQPELFADQSMLGEEDPGAALDSMPRHRCEDQPGHAEAADESVCPTCGARTLSAASAVADRAALLGKSIARWENEGGAGGRPAPESSMSGDGQTDVLLTNAELVQLQVRVIALENLVTALLAGATGPTSELARELAASIAPRPGFTPHRLTLHAAAQMIHLVERSGLFRSAGGPQAPGA